MVFIRKWLSSEYTLPVNIKERIGPTQTYTREGWNKTEACYRPSSKPISRIRVKIIERGTEWPSIGVVSKKTDARTPCSNSRLYSLKLAINTNPLPNWKLDQKESISKKITNHTDLLAKKSPSSQIDQSDEDDCRENDPKRSEYCNRNNE